MGRFFKKGIVLIMVGVFILGGAITGKIGKTAPFSKAFAGEDYAREPSEDLKLNQDITVIITYPQCWVYVFDHRIDYTVDKPLMIGGFTIEVDVVPNNNVEKVTFYLNQNCIGEDTQYEYSCYCNTQNFGKAKIKVVAETFTGEVGEEIIDILYFKIC